MTVKTIDEMLADVIKLEGGFVDRAEDKGGPTKYGITIPALSAYRERYGNAGFVDTQDIIELSPVVASAIYKQDYYLTPKLDLLPAMLQPVVFDMSVNMGPKTAIKLLQSVVHKLATPLIFDGIIGPQTLQSAKTACNVCGDLVLNKICAARITFYRSLVTRDASQAVFLKGWTHRAESFLA